MQGQRKPMSNDEAVSEELRLTVLRRGAAGEAVTTDELTAWLAWEHSHPDAAAFGLTADAGTERLVDRWQHFQALSPTVLALCRDRFDLHDTDAVLLTLWRFWLPLALELIAEQQQLSRPVVQGVLGGQGTGKTTLGIVLSELLSELGVRMASLQENRSASRRDYRCVSFSLDDLYKSYVERQRLRESDPRLRWRGPPGTHDVDIGLELLDNLRQANRRKPAIVPRFDKSLWGGAGDKTQPEIIDAVDVVLFEGWFVGVRPVTDDRIFENAPDPICTEEDRAFARDCNERLLDYVPLWHRLDRLLILQPNDYRFSLLWRTEAEHKAIAQGKAGLSDAELADFVNYFWKALHPDLFITPLTRNPLLTNLVVEIQADRRIGRIYRP